MEFLWTHIPNRLAACRVWSFPLLTKSTAIVPTTLSPWRNDVWGCVFLATSWLASPENGAPKGNEAFDGPLGRHGSWPAKERICQGGAHRCPVEISLVRHKWHWLRWVLFHYYFSRGSAVVESKSLAWRDLARPGQHFAPLDVEFFPQEEMPPNMWLFGLQVSLQGSTCQGDPTTTLGAFLGNARVIPFLL